MLRHSTFIRTLPVVVGFLFLFGGIAKAEPPNQSPEWICQNFSHNPPNVYGSDPSSMTQGMCSSSIGQNIGSNWYRVSCAAATNTSGNTWASASTAYQFADTNPTVPIGDYTAQCWLTGGTIPECTDPEFPFPIGDPPTDCIADPCDGEIIEGPYPSAGEQAFYGNNGYSCGPPVGGVNCKIYPMGESPDGGYFWREHSEGGKCSTTEASDPDGTPTDTNSPGGDDPTDSDPYGDCGSASPYDQFCGGDPSVDCPGGVCREGCGYMNADFICTNPDYNPPPGSGPFDDPLSPPDPDITGDGDPNVDMGPTNALLQEIRNNTSQIATNTEGSEAVNIDLSGVESRLDSINSRFDSEDDWIDPADLAQLLADEETNKLKITTVDGEQWVLTEQEDGSVFIDKLSDFETGVNSLFPSFGGSCPALVMKNGLGQDIYVETTEWSAWLRAAMSLMLWAGVFVSGYFMFFKWALL